MLTSEKSAFMQVNPICLDGKSITPEQLDGKVCLLITARRGVVDAANELAKEILFHLNDEKQFACLMIADLSTLPRLSWGIAKTIMNDRSQRTRKELEERFLNSGRGYTSPKFWVYIPDWEGQLTLSLFQQSPHEAYAIFKEDLSHSNRFEPGYLKREKQHLRDRLQSFILDGNGNLRAHFSGETATPEILATLQSMLSS